MTKFPTAEVAMPTLALTTDIEYGGDVRGQRHFVASAVPASRPDEPNVTTALDPAGERADDTHPARDCDRLNRQCEHHEDDRGTVIHRGPIHRERIAADDDLLTHTLIQWGDDDPRLEYVGGGSWPELDLDGTDALIAAVEKQLAALRDSRAHLAAALGVAPPTQPPEQQTARPADGETDGQVSE